MPAKSIVIDTARAAEKREKMVLGKLPGLIRLAWKAVDQQQMKNIEFVMVCIEICDRWYALADELSLDDTFHVDNPFSSKLIPGCVGTGVFSSEICRYLACQVPEVAAMLLTPPKGGAAKCIALDEDGCSVYSISPSQGLQRL